MAGDDRQRFCSQCQKNVYNISAMTRREAGRLLAQAEGGICTRLYRRADGTVLTEDCPVGWNAMKRRVSRVTGIVLSSGLAFYGSAFAQSPQTAVEAQAEQPKGSVWGVVTDATGSVIPRSRVKLLEITQGTKFTSSTNDSGVYRMEGIPVGVYTLTIENPGFRAFSKQISIFTGSAIQQDTMLALDMSQMGSMLVIGDPVPLLTPSVGPKPKRTFFNRLFHKA